MGSAGFASTKALNGSFLLLRKLEVGIKPNDHILDEKIAPQYTDR